MNLLQRVGGVVARGRAVVGEGRARLATWRRRRRVTGRWRAMGPADQVAGIMAALERSPNLRKQFRRALGIRSDESIRLPRGLR